MDKQLEQIIKNLAQTLNTTYGFCGHAQGEKFAMLNTANKEGKDIIIKVEVKD